MAAEEVVDRECRATVRHVRHRKPSGACQQFASQMLLSAGTGRTERQGLRRFFSASSSCILLTGSLGPATSTKGASAASATGVRSVIGSYRIFLKTSLFSDTSGV